MSKPLVKGLLAAAVALATTTAFTAQEARTLSVTATIAGTCSLSTSGPMAFGNLNLSSSADETKQITVTYKCVANTAVSSFQVGGVIGNPTGTYTGNMQGLAPGNTGTLIPYTITWSDTGAYTADGFTGTGKQIVLTGTIRNQDYVGKPADSYSGAVVIAINY